MVKYNDIILGGGLTALSVCDNMMKRQSESNVLILESTSQLGGLARSYEFQGVTFDFGPHVFRTSDQALLSRVSSLLELTHYKTNPASFKYGQIFDHVVPVITKANIEMLPSDIRRKAISELDSAPGPGSSNNFQEALEKEIGHTLYWEFFGQYSKKWWGIDPSSLSVELAPKNLRIGDKPSYAHITTRFDTPQQEFYPARGGYGAIATSLARSILKEYNHRVATRLNSAVSKIVTDGGVATSVVTSDGAEHAAKGRVFSTMPFTLLCRLLGIQSSLAYRSEICVFLTVSKSTTRRFPKSWMYFPEADVVFSRFYDMGQFSEHNESQDLRGFVAEMTCTTGDADWARPEERATERVIADLDRLGLVKERDVVGSMVVKGDSVHPILTTGYRDERARAAEKVREQASNVIPVGRTGGFNYWNSDSVLLQYQRSP